MKIRNGFVSNSSSSSFIVPDMRVPEDHEYSSLKSFFNLDESIYDYKGNLRRIYTITLPVLEGNKCFGWEDTRYTEFADKLNYLFLQIESMHQDVRLKNKLEHTLEKALKSICEKAYNTTGLKYGEFTVRVDYNHLFSPTSAFSSIYKYDDIYYIDHQSTWGENEPGVVKYFAQNEPDADLMEKYLVGESYIQGGNDNEDGSSEYYDSLEILHAFLRSGRSSS